MECNQVPGRPMGVSAVLREDGETRIAVNSGPCMTEALDALQEGDSMPCELTDVDEVVMHVDVKATRSADLRKVVLLHRLV